jgi:hypothetical protein
MKFLAIKNLVFLSEKAAYNHGTISFFTPNTVFSVCTFHYYPKVPIF